MNYSPKLKKAMEQIKGILDEHDIAGVVMLHTPGHGEYLMKIDPSYSAAKYETIPGEENALGIRVKIKEAEVGKNKAKQLAEDTTNMFHILTATGSGLIMQLIDMDEFMQKHYNPDHSGPGHSSHTSQNN